MTFKEKLQQEHPEAISENYDGGCKNCPYDYGYCEKPPIGQCRKTTCTECWNREMPSEVQQVKQTNGDKIRAMSNEELAKTIMCPYDTAGDPIDIMPCVTELGEQELVSPEYCHKCMMKWLEREAK